MAHIRILGSETYRLIAAGEVIDRPASALRELLDNSIDAGATEIRVEIAKGGIELLSVSDNGQGMSREDLGLSTQEHATSKIEKADDLLRIRTLGFRGEALASIAAVARIEILSKDESSDTGWKLSQEPGGEARLEPAPARRGTSVSIRGIFERFPARRQFLKRPSSEAAQCRQVFLEKAAAHPGIAFVWSSGAELEFLAPSDRIRRLVLLYPDIPAPVLSLFETEIAGCPTTIVYADPSFYRRDRKYLQVYVNRRRVPEWGLSGALEYAFNEYMPGGTKPCAFLFVEIDPSQADFNIHPAKREVRLKNAEALKSGIHSALRARLRSSLGEGPKPLDWSSGGPIHHTSLPGAGTWPKLDGKALDRAFWDRMEGEKDIKESWARESEDLQRKPFRYLGRAFGPFIVFESKEELFILDQHAAQERILFEKLKSRSGKSQSLLVPFVMDIQDEDMKTGLAASIKVLQDIGYRLEKKNEQLIITAVPSLLGDRGLSILVESLDEDAPPKANAEEKADAILASIACKAAIKDGELLEDKAAQTLITQSLALELPRCPHGRPIWIRLDRKSLEKMVGR